jgi:hypothetical protein
MPELVRFEDVGSVSSRKKTPEGFLVVTADFARTGIQKYHVGELLRDEVPERFRANPMQVVKVLRHEDQVFDRQSMASFEHKPVTDGHPPQFVNSKNFRDFQIGLSRGNVAQHKDKLRVGLTIQDAKAIKRVEDGVDYLSAGYDAEIAWESGEHPIHGHYDAKQMNIRGNHIAVVDKARGGPEVRINDSWPEATEPQKGDQNMASVKRKIDGVTVEFSDQASEVVDKLIASQDKMAGELDALRTRLTDAEADRDKTRGELDALKKQQLTDAEIEAKAQARLEVIDRAKKLHPQLDAKGLTEREIKAAAIEHADKSFEITDETSDDYLEGVFHTLATKAPEASKQTLQDAVRGAGNGKDDQDRDIVAEARAANQKIIDAQIERLTA